MYPIFRVTAVLAMLSLLASAASQSAAQTTAPIMPRASNSLLLDISTAGERLVVAGERGHVMYSDDHGTNWQQAKVPTVQMLTGVHFVDAQHGWTAGHDGLILVCNDGGENWRVQRDGLAVQQQTNLELRERAHRQIAELQSALNRAEPDMTADSLMQLEDAQMELEYADIALTEPVFTSPLMDVWFQDLNRGWAVGAFGTFVATVDGGQHWSNAQAELNNPDEFHLNAITGDAKGRVFIAGEGGVMFRSMDSGRSWETLESFYQGSWFGVIYTSQHDALLIFGLRGNLFRSTDFGTTWEAIVSDNNITLAGGSASAAGEIVLVGGGGTVLRSSDGGQSFARTIVEDRLSLSSGTEHNGRLILIGRGGVKVREAAQ